MKLSVIIPCYNAANTVNIQLEALAKQQWSEPWEVIVSDNGSTDNSMEIVQEYKNRLPNLRIVDASARRGQPYALNVGVKEAIGESVVFCDADDEVAPGWVAAMGEALSKYDFVACRFDIEKLNAPWLKKFRGNPQANGLQLIWYPPYLHHAGGGGFGFKRSLYKAIGEFDESLPLLHDTDYSFRLQLAGIKLHFLPEAVLHVRFRDTLSGTYRQSRGYAEYNVFLSKRYQSTGAKISCPFKKYIWDWIFLLRCIPQNLDKTGRFRLAWLLGRQIGRLRGIIKHHVPPV